LIGEFEMQRPLEGIDLSPYASLVKEYEANGVLEIGPLDELRAQVWPYLADRTALTLLLIVREIYREITIRSGYFDRIVNKTWNAESAYR
jgi:hypothetical protein